MYKIPSVVSRTQLSNTFLGELVQVCIVTRDHRRAIDGLVNMGFGPWAIRTFDSTNLTDRTYRGKPSQYSMRICGAKAGNMSWEIVEPLEGPSIYTEFLDRHGDGVQHFGFNCADGVYEEQLRRLSARGCEMVQSGVYLGKARFHYFETDLDAKLVVEIVSVPKGFTFPEPESWVPGPPPQ